jgi:hypothetical protein
VPATAEARTLSDIRIGGIDGEYWVAGADYNGGFYPQFASECVDVQRKAGGAWRDNVSTATGGGWHCHEKLTLSWWIEDDTLAKNTEAIRLVSDQGSILVLCTSKSNCQVM